MVDKQVLQAKAIILDLWQFRKDAYLLNLECHSRRTSKLGTNSKKEGICPRCEIKAKTATAVLLLCFWIKIPLLKQWMDELGWAWMNAGELHERKCPNVNLRKVKSGRAS